VFSAEYTNDAILLYSDADQVSIPFALMLRCESELCVYFSLRVVPRELDHRLKVIGIVAAEWRDQEKGDRNA